MNANIRILGTSFESNFKDINNNESGGAVQNIDYINQSNHSYLEPETLASKNGNNNKLSIDFMSKILLFFKIIIKNIQINQRQLSSH